MNPRPDWIYNDYIQNWDLFFLNNLLTYDGGRPLDAFEQKRLKNLNVKDQKRHKKTFNSLLVSSKISEPLEGVHSTNHLILTSHISLPQTKQIITVPEGRGGKKQVEG